MRRPGRGFLAAFCEDLIERETGPADSALRDEARAWVMARIEGAGEVSRLGLECTAVLLAAGVRVATGRSYRSLPPERRAVIRDRLAATRAPVVSDFVRAVRALSVTYVYERRFPT